MDNKHGLSLGSLAVIMRGGQVDNPLMQVLGSKKIVSSSAEKDRFRMLLSDGKYLFSFAMIAPQSMNNIAGAEVPIFSIIKLKRYITSVINNTGRSGEKRILVILEFEIVTDGKDVGEKFGSPVSLPDELEQGDSKQGDVRKAESSGAGQPPAKRPHLSHEAQPNTSLNVSLQDQLTHPISSLSPYQNKWVIKARVTNKSAIRTWSNSRGEGKLFSIDLVDESGEIKATAFRDMVDKYYDFIQVDKVYYISKCQLKMANKQFSTLKNDYEMMFSGETVVQECEDDTTSIPTTQFNFLSIDKVANMEVGSLVDIIGICKAASEVLTFTAKSTGKEFKKRELTLVDMSKTCVAVTLWGTEAENYNQTFPVVAIKGGKVGEFGGGKNVSLLGSSVIRYNPDINEAFVIRGWYDNGGDKEEASNISARTGLGNFQSNWMSFKEAKDQGLGHSERGDYYQTKGTVLLMRSENSFYKACPQENCNKKIIDMENGQYRCEKCNAEFPNFKYRLLGNMNVGDWSGNQWVSMFTSEAEAVIGKTAQEIGETSERSGDELSALLNAANFKQFIFRCRAKMETYNDEARLKTVAVKVDKINYKEYNSYLISQIQQMIDN